MKKIFVNALLSVIAVMGAVNFTGCSSSDEVINNPDFDPETNTVKTQLAISLPNSVYGNATTRQTNTVVQNSPSDFRGIQKIRLIAFESIVPSSNSDVSPYQDKVYTLADISAFDNEAKQNAKIYNDLAIPVGTGAFMLYGEAKPSGSNFENGVLHEPATYSTTASSYTFSLEPIYPSGAVNERAKALLEYIKGIRATASSITNSDLHSYMVAFQPTAGSSASILAAVQNLWDHARLTNDATGVAAIKAAIQTQNGTECASIDNNDKISFINTMLQNYPANINLPDGAASISWSGTEPAVVTEGNPNLYVMPLSSYVYPASLYYRANTDISVSDNSDVSTTFGDKDWNTIIQTSYNKTKVDGNTHSIALKNQIQYAVGRLDLQVQAAAATLYDGNGDAVSVAAAGFPVSAVLIGGQRNVGYHFAPLYNSPFYTIYDNVMNGTVAAKAGENMGTNRTLVLETADGQNEVNVAVEFTNNSGKAFKGKDGVVPEGGKFYLVGVLDLNKNKTSGNRTLIFEQDYITKALFTIAQGTAGDENTEGLGAAYNVIPDLKTPNLEVAFSVNLDWIEGLTFNVKF